MGMTRSSTSLWQESTLLILLAAEPSKLVGDHNVELRGTLNNLLALLGGDIVGDLGTVGPMCAREGSIIHR